MNNLAGQDQGYVEKEVVHELELAGIPAIRLPSWGNSEVHSKYIGQIGDVTFVRAWYYWMVECCVPFNVAMELYDFDDEIKRTIRVKGNGADCNPADVIQEWCRDDPSLGAIHSYHIDSQEGLNLFVSTLKKYRIVPDVTHYVQNSYPIDIEKYYKNKGRNIKLALEWMPGEVKEMNLSSYKAIQFAMELLCRLVDNDEIDSHRLHDVLKKLNIIS
jgi:hypothetical protein